ncbi:MULTISPECIES: N-acetylglucosamine-6-phosphate deacetylase [unclassified Sphingomonas]|uniref:N-acetylglucosamine-6-phosphate deacetylase n=1 Tax=unclassified Sphingomonas TaxID=196159 RepID=UPI0006F6AC9C|nr:MULTISPECIES: N-acetylglucosamine-6-phosphate deacetylase [unclassified Sphingomonas]KQN00355.1 N-acetylglucosamine-6-phosphate deacetylase [Sphingomonas sp. Leaf25]
MSGFVFHGGRVLAEGCDGASCAFRVEDGRIADFHVDGAAETIDLGGGWLVPGFVDTQVNGGGGVLFNDTPSVEGIAAIGAAHARYGTTAFLPTLISDRLDVVATALDAVDAAIEQGVPGVVGIHVEGPFLNPVRKGIHDAAHFRALDDAAIELLTRPRKGVVMVTLAPERNDTAAIGRLVAAGVIVSIGHSDATYEQARAAIDAGARGVTHLYNAMSPLRHRDPGVVGAVLEDRSVYAGLIVDGAHLHPAAIRVALAARPHDRFMLVTDAMPTVGADTKEFVLNGWPIHVENGVCVGPDGTLAGCDLDMAQAVANTHALGVDLVDAVAMASANPAAFLRLSHRIGSLIVGGNADFVWLAPDLTVRGTWIGGVRVF